MYTFITVVLGIIAVVSSLLMIGVILLQNNKGGGGLGAISGGMTETMFGASAANTLVKITIVLAVVFMLSTLLLATVTGRMRNSKSVAEKYSASQEAVKVEKVDVAKDADISKSAGNVEVKNTEAKPAEKKPAAAK